MLAGSQLAMFNRQTMIIACPACNTRYVVPDTAIGVEGRTVRCAKCRHSWFQEGPRLDVPEPAQPVPAQPAPTPAPSPIPPLPDPVAQPPRHEPVQPAPIPVPNPIPAPAPPDPAGSYAETAPPAPPVYSDEPLPPPPQISVPVGSYYDDTQSQFEHEPPFRPRRNPARMWTIAAALFAIVTLGAVAAVAWYGLPSWVPFAQPMFADEQPGLKLSFPEKQQGMRELQDRTWFFEANGTVANVSQTSQKVPVILVVLRDARDRVVYTGEITPPKRSLAPGEIMPISQALVPVPRSAAKAQYGWKPGR